MGAFDFSVPDELQKRLSRISSIDTIAPKMLSRAAPIVLAAIKSRTPSDTGTLAESLRAKKPKKDKNECWFCQVTFEGTDDRTAASKRYPAKNRKPVRNNEKAAIKEFGTSKRKAEPFVRPAVDSVKNEVAAAMQAVLNEEGC